MAVTIGEVEAVLLARDRMSPTLVAAAERVKSLEHTLGSLGVTTVDEFNKMNTVLQSAQANYQSLAQLNAGAVRQAVQDANFQVTNLGTSANVAAGHVSNLAKIPPTIPPPPPATILGFSNLSGMVERLAVRFAIIMAIRELISFGSNVLEGNEALLNLSRSTGITLDTLQRLNFVGLEFGVTSAQIGAAIDQLASRIGSDNAGAASALHKLGLSMSDLKKQGTEELLQTVAKAFDTAGSSIDRIAIASELFGSRTLARNLLPMLTDLVQKMKDVPQTAIISPETVKSAADFETSLKRLYVELEAGTINGVKFASDIGKAFSDALTPRLRSSEAEFDRLGLTLRNLVIAGSTFDTSLFSLFSNFERLQSLTDKYAHSTTQAGVAQQGAAARGETLNLMLKDQAEHTGRLNEEQKAYLDTLAMNNILTAENAKELGITSVQFTQYKRDFDASVQAGKEYAAAQVELETSGSRWKDTLDKMDVSMKEHLQSGIAAGLSQKTLEVLYGATAVQVKAVAAAYQEYKKEIENATKAEKDLSDLHAKTVQAEIKLEEDRLKGREEALKQTLQLDEKYWKQRLEDGKVSQTRYNSEIISLESQYFRQREIMLRNDRDLHIASINEQERKELEALREQFNLKKVSEEDYEKERLEVMRRYHLLRMGLEEDYTRDALLRLKNQRAAEQAAADAARKEAHAFKDDWFGATEVVIKGVKRLVDQFGDLVKVEKEAAELARRAGGAFEVSSLNFESTIMGMITSGGFNPSGLGSNINLSRAYDLARQGYSMQEILDIFSHPGQPVPPPKGPRIPGFASGVDNFEGGAAVLGEHGPELAILPKGTSVTPHGSSPATGSQIFQNTFNVNGTAEESARKIYKILMNQLKSVRQFPTA